MLTDQKDEHKTQEERDMEKYAVIEDAKQYMDEYREDMIVYAQKLLKVKSLMINYMFTSHNIKYKQ